MVITIDEQRKICAVLAGIIITIAAVFLIFVNSSQAGLAVYPSRIEVQAMQGESKTFELNAVNSSRLALKSHLKPWDFARDEDGRPRPISPKDVKKFYGCSSWLEFEAEPIRIEPDQTGTFKVTVNVPEDADYGTHYAYVTVINDPIVEEKDKKKGSAAMPVGFRVSALLLVGVGSEGFGSSAPELKRSATVKDFGVNRINVNQTVTLKPKIENSGNIHLLLAKESKIEIWKGKKKEATIRVPEYTLLPENTLAIPLEWKADSPFGKYEAKFYGYVDLEKPLTAKRTFWVISWKVLLAAISGIVLLTVGLIIFFKKFKIQLAPKS